MLPTYLADERKDKASGKRREVPLLHMALDVESKCFKRAEHGADGSDSNGSQSAVDNDKSRKSTSSTSANDDAVV